VEYYDFIKQAKVIVCGGGNETMIYNAYIQDQDINLRFNEDKLSTIVE
jgi:hypothetical protein